MNDVRFTRLLKSGLQADFNRLYSELLQYAEERAKGLPDGTAEEACNRIADLIAAGNPPDCWFHAKTIIDNYLVDLRRGQKLVSFEVFPSSLSPKKSRGTIGFVDIYTGGYDKEESPTWGWQGIYLKDSHGFPKVRITGLPEGKERDICLLYWGDGLKQKEIADKLNLDKRYVSKTIKKYRRVEPENDNQGDFLRYPK